MMSRRKPLSLRAITLAVLLVLLISAVSVAVLVWPIPLFRIGNVSERFDALRLALTIGAGAAGGATLILAGRRQVHLEESTVATDSDAQERRITELQIKAVEQLGSEKAPVRLGGLLALERLGQDNPAHRQVVVDIICSYLRMPFDISRDDYAHLPKRSEAALAISQKLSQDPDRRADRMELEVRLTAQSILRRHLLTGDVSRFWKLTELDLSSAQLIDFRFEDCTSGAVNFAGATFIGFARFYQCTINGVADFAAVRFTRNAWFRDAHFMDDAWFGGADFRGEAGFRRAIFRKSVSFGGRAWFGASSFYGGIDFEDAVLEGEIELRNARIDRTQEMGRTLKLPDGWILDEDPNSCDWYIISHDDAH